MPHRHPQVVSRLRIFGTEVSRTGMVFAGLGCPNGCDFCCTSHFFKRKHVRLLPTGRDIHRAVERYQQIEPGMSIVILDEDFLLNRRRAMEFRDCVQEAGRPLSIFVCASVRAISQYTVQEILEMGIDGFWIGYEGTRSGYAKQQGRAVGELFRDLRDHGVGILASMIVGLPYQTPEIIEEEMSGLLALRPALSQFLIYGPTPGTPFFDRVVKEGLLHRDLAEDPEKYYRRCTGFAAMVTHPTMTPAQIESSQARCFREDFRRLGPSIYRSIETWLLGYLKLKDSPNAFLRDKARRFAAEIRKAYPVFRAGRVLGPTRRVRARIAVLQERVHAALGRPTWAERARAVVATGLAAWTGLTLKTGLFQHPKLMRHTFRVPGARAGRAWNRLRVAAGGHTVEVERRPLSTVWVRVAGTLDTGGASQLVERLRRALRRKRERVVLDLARLVLLEEEVSRRISEGLVAYRERVRILLPLAAE
jgi:haloalkane dehalogenase